MAVFDFTTFYWEVPNLTGTAWTNLGYGGGINGNTMEFQPGDYDEVSTWGIPNMPVDFATMDNLDISIRWQNNNYSNDTDTITITIKDGSGTAVHTNPLTITCTDNLVWHANSAYSLTLTAAALLMTAADWNNAYVELSGSHSASMGGDGITWRIDFISFNGGYVPNYTPPTVTLDTANGATVSSNDPILQFTGHDGIDPDLRFDLQTKDSAFAEPHRQTDYANFDIDLYSNRYFFQCFRSVGGALKGVTVKIKKSATALGGNLNVQLWTCTGAYDNSASRRGSLIATSTTYGWATLPIAAGTTEDVYFPFPTPPATVAGTDYVITIQGTFSNINMGQRHYWGTGVYAGTSGTWNGSTFDLGFTGYFIIDELEFIEDVQSYLNTDFSSANGEPYIPEEQVTYTLPDIELYTDNQTYYWRVRVTDPNGSGDISAWVERSFIFELAQLDLLIASSISVALTTSDIDTVLEYYSKVVSAIGIKLSVAAIDTSMTYEAAIQLTPNNGANTTRPTLLTWSAHYSAEAYQVQIATDVNFTNIVEDNIIKGLTFLFNTELPSTEYFWRVRAVLPPVPEY